MLRKFKVVTYYIIVTFYIYMYLHHMQKFEAFKHGIQPFIAALEIVIRKRWLKSDASM